MSEWTILGSFDSDDSQSDTNCTFSGMYSFYYGFSNTFYRVSSILVIKLMKWLSNLSFE